MKRTMLALTIAAVLFAACGDDDGATPTTEPPDAGDMIHSEAFVDSVEFIYLESYPVQVRAMVAGNLPTPCHQVAWEVGEPAEGRVVAEVYSLVDPGEMCAQVLEPFEVTLDVGSFESGDYTLELNGADHPFTI
jgi:hypothetical protein